MGSLVADHSEGAFLVSEGKLQDIAELHHFATRLAPELKQGDLLILTGELGAGKTTFTRALAAALGVTETVSSPTFILARQHRNPIGPALIHLDAYRLNGFLELDDLDLDFENSVTVAEWGKGIIEPEFASWLELELIPESVTSTNPEEEIVWDEEQETPRHYRLTAVGKRWQYLLESTL